MRRVYVLSPDLLVLLTIMQAKESVTDMEKSRLTMDLEHFNYNDEALWG
jgi:hypothetical protein